MWYEKTEIFLSPPLQKVFVDWWSSLMAVEMPRQFTLTRTLLSQSFLPNLQISVYSRLPPVEWFSNDLISLYHLHIKYFFISNISHHRSPL